MDDTGIAGGGAAGGAAGAGGSGASAAGGNGVVSAGGQGGGAGASPTAIGGSCLPTPTTTGGAGAGGTTMATGGAGGNLGGAGGLATGGASAVDVDLVLHYTFDESAGTTAADGARFGGVAHDATLTTMGTGGMASFSTQRMVGSHAVSLVPGAIAPDANGGFVSVPALQNLAPQAITIAVWVNLAANSAAQNWERIFDFGSGTGTAPNMYLSARASDAPNTPIRFAITNSGHAATSEQRLDGPTTLTPNSWHHIAVVLPAGSPFTGTLYIDGVSVATNSTMTLHAADLGAASRNWLGRSQFSGTSGSNPCLDGMLDDFRVYKRALSAADISALFAIR